MSHFAKYLSTFEKAQKVDPRITQEEFDRMAADNRKCHVCNRHVWRYAQTGLCFTCTTGQADASDDYEIGSRY